MAPDASCFGGVLLLNETAASARIEGACSSDLATTVGMAVDHPMSTLFEMAWTRTGGATKNANTAWTGDVHSIAVDARPEGDEKVTAPMTDS